MFDSLISLMTAGLTFNEPTYGVTVWFSVHHQSLLLCGKSFIASSSVMVYSVRMGHFENQCCCWEHMAFDSESLFPSRGIFKMSPMGRHSATFWSLICPYKCVNVKFICFPFYETNNSFLSPFLCLLDCCAERSGPGQGSSSVLHRWSKPLHLLWAQNPVQSSRWEIMNSHNGIMGIWHEILDISWPVLQCNMLYSKLI